MTRDNGISQKIHNELVLSFLAVRRAIGGLGFFLPVALLAYGVLGGGLLPSLSAAYYSPMREVFVGTLIAQAVFLWSYEGFRPDRGDILSDTATARVAAAAVARVPVQALFRSLVWPILTVLVMLAAITYVPAISLGLGWWMMP